jgi:hypothetical protein
MDIWGYIAVAGLAATLLWGHHEYKERFVALESRVTHLEAAKPATGATQKEFTAADW